MARDTISDVIRAIEEQTGHKVTRYSHQKKDFNDTGLGLPARRGEMNAQVIVPGYVVDATLRDGKGKEYQRTYHSNLEGSMLKRK